MDMKWMVNVNELREILEKHFKEDLSILGVDVADMNNQWNPERKRIRVGGVLTWYVEVQKGR